jgi:hypothetical protein
LTSSTGATGEKNLFDQRAAWMDYSGPMPIRGSDGSRGATIEGVTLMDHPQNSGQPTTWHVRDDGWMGPSLCHAGAVTLVKKSPLRLSYLLHVHSGDLMPDRTNAIHAEWAKRTATTVVKSTRPHHTFEFRRG